MEKFEDLEQGVKKLIVRGFQFKMAEKDMHSSPPARAPKLQLGVEQPPTGGTELTKKKATPRTKKLQQNSRTGTIMEILHLWGG